MIKVEIFTPEDVLTNNAVFSTEAEADEWITYCTPYFVENFKVVKTDVTQEYEDSAVSAQGLQAMVVGAKARALVWAINAQKGATSEQLEAMLGDATIARAERLLLNGALETAKLVIGQIDSSFFTAAEKARVIALIDRG